MSETPESRSPSTLNHLRKRAVVGVLRAWKGVESTARHVVGAEVRPSVPKEDLAHLRAQMRECLDPKGGELTARAHTVELGRTYLQLNEAGKARFFHVLATDFAGNEKAIEKAANAYLKAQAGEEKAKAEAALASALISPRVTLLKQFTALPDGFKFLVDMRADVLKMLARHKDYAFKALEVDLKAILSSWFDIGLLDLEQITWNSPAALLEKLIAYEAVHQIHSWDDLKNRLDDDRRIYAFLHNKMRLEPLIFVQVAFVQGLADNIQVLLDTNSPLMDIEEADTAIFYSISNAQSGLAGISFGNFLIKRVVTELTREFKQIKTFATLSPIPGFRGWLDPMLVKDEAALLTPSEQKEITHITGGKGLASLLAGEWHKDKKTAEKLKPILMRLCAHYLLNERKGEKPLDPVSNFHLFNGARLEQLNWLADTSAKGLKQSAGMMVNYYYKLSEIDENHEAFAAEGKVVASRKVKGYL